MNLINIHIHDTEQQCVDRKIKNEVENSGITHEDIRNDVADVATTAQTQRFFSEIFFLRSELVELLGGAQVTAKVPAQEHLALDIAVAQ